MAEVCQLYNKVASIVLKAPKTQGLRLDCDNLLVAYRLFMTRWVQGRRVLDKVKSNRCFHVVERNNDIPRLQVC